MHNKLMDHLRRLIAVHAGIELREQRYLSIAKICGVTGFLAYFSFLILFYVIGAEVSCSTLPISKENIIRGLYYPLQRLSFTRCYA